STSLLSLFLQAQEVRTSPSFRSRSNWQNMEYMYQIVLLGLQSIRNMEEIFSPNPYTQEKIDDVREKWRRYFISSCL
ncbi:hypothetical protein SOVF_190000, partial [Spinacia oleracea]